MSKFLLPLFAVFIFVSAAVAQNGKVFTVKKADAGLRLMKNPECMTVVKKNKPSSVKKIQLADNQKILGPYDTDDIAGKGNGLGLPNLAGNITIATLIDIDYAMKFNGGKVVSMRYGVTEPAQVNRVFIKALKNGNSWVDLVSENVSGTSAVGWNTVTLATPYTLDMTGIDVLLMGFEYVQSNANNGQTYNAECYPLSMAGPASPSFIYGNYGDGLGWYNIGSESYGSLSVQAVVESDSYPKTDIILGALTTDFYNKVGDRLAYSFSLKNFGTVVPKEYTVNVSIDGSVVKTFNTPISFSASSSATVTDDITLPAALALGKHTLTVAVDKIDGTVPTVNTGDDSDEAVFTVYGETFKRSKQLVEHFTSNSCTYCPIGDRMLEALAAKRSDIARVSVHGIMNPSVIDPYNSADCDKIMVLEELTGYPSASFNRICFDSKNEDGYSMVKGLGYNEIYKDQVAEMFSGWIDDNNAKYPAFATVNVSAIYDPEAGKLNVKVVGDGVEKFSDFMGEDAKLSVYLVEDGLISRQLNNGTWVTKFTHNCVLRKCVTSVTGDVINWNGNSYENDYSVKWTSSWKHENMRVVAFISRPLDSESLEDKYVTNVEMVNVQNATGVSKPFADGNGIYEVSRYTVGGTRLAAPRKGINIVKMSNGETRKVVVRQ